MDLLAEILRVGSQSKKVKETYRALTSPPSPNRPPLPQDYNYYVLIETLGGDQAKEQQIPIFTLN